MPKNTARDRLPRVNGNGRRWATYKQTAEYLDLNERTVRQMVEDGRITAYNLGARVVRFDLNEIDAAMTPQAPIDPDRRRPSIRSVAAAAARPRASRLAEGEARMPPDAKGPGLRQENPATQRHASASTRSNRQPRQGGRS